jgi:choline dehydrogenase
MGSPDSPAQEFAKRTRINQRKLTSDLKPRYHFIICGSGSSGSVVARRLAETAEIDVLLLEAGGSDDVPSVVEAAQWPSNIRSERDWGFKALPNPHLNGRIVPLSMGKVLGGGSSINAMTYARGHKKDWDFFASEVRDPRWSYESVLKIYRRIEDWQGPPDPVYRGTGGPVFVQPAPDPNPVAPAMVEAARSVGIPTFENPNGRMMEAEGGASLIDMRARHGKRQSVFRSYVLPYMDRPNLTVLTHALVTRLIFAGKKAVGVEISHDGRTHRIEAALEVIVSLGAIHTPKLLMQSGLGDQAELQRAGIAVVEHLPGVGQNFQDHVALGCIWEYSRPTTPRNTGTEAVSFWKSDHNLESPDLQISQAELPIGSVETLAAFSPPAASWTLYGGVIKPKSRGRIRLGGPNPTDPIIIESNMLADRADLKAAVACVELCRAIGNSAPLAPFVKREVAPGNLKGFELENFVRNAAESYYHETCTAKMGCDSMSVVDGHLKVYGVDNLRVADGSIMPRVTTGNTMAPCIIIGERAAELLRTQYELSA